jgi:uncharacterized membrane protein YeaQ/YmgE (transglycosylase-associated protein family)
MSSFAKMAADQDTASWRCRRPPGPQAVFNYYCADTSRERGCDMGIIAALIIGAIAGWLAGLIVRGAGFGLIGNIVVGMIGALVAGFVLPRLGVILAAGTVGQIIDATIGAVIVLVILSLIRRA